MLLHHHFLGVVSICLMQPVRIAVLTCIWLLFACQLLENPLPSIWQALTQCSSICQGLGKQYQVKIAWRKRWCALQLKVNYFFQNWPKCPFGLLRKNFSHVFAEGVFFSRFLFLVLLWQTGVRNSIDTSFNKYLMICSSVSQVSFHAEWGLL